MKYKKAGQPLNDLINRSKILILVTNAILKLFFAFIRFVNKHFANENGILVIVSLNRLGDTVFTIPAVREIQKTCTQKIILLCFPESVPIYQLEFKDINFCTVKHDEFRFGQRIAKHSIKLKLKKIKPEIILDLTGSMISASLIYNINAKQIIGINREQFSSIYDHFVSIREEPQLVDIYLDAISPLTNSFSRLDSKKQNKIINPVGRILIQPFAGWKEKEWNLKKFIILADKLNEDYRVILITQKNQLSADVIDEIDYLNIDLIQTRSVDELINRIDECALFIGNDSGPVNIANFLGKPTLSVYGATNPDFTASKETHQIFIQKELTCSSKKNEKYCAIGVGIYECPGVQCMNLLNVDEVYDELTPLIEDYCNNKK